ncbi:Putative transposable element [Caligus rogercresseyi]|uniref:Transposable element n=1 Tax=Caligus rogercresseyi TaxID=217165 RepID=A0A7T8JZB7_CALRO|nr:Putative transposable element [Caligus rogercresseyi]
MSEFGSTHFWKLENTDRDLEAVKATGIEGKVGSGAKKSLDGEEVKQILMADPRLNRDLEDEFIPWVQENFPDGNVVLQQDGAPAHTAWATQVFLSPDANSLDYAFWPQIESKACKLCPPNIAALKAAVNQEWVGMDEDSVVKVCQAFTKCLMAIVTANGGYIE